MKLQRVFALLLVLFPVFLTAGLANATTERLFDHTFQVAANSWTYYVVGQIDRAGKSNLELRVQISVSGGDSLVKVWLIWGNENYYDWVHTEGDVPGEFRGITYLHGFTWSEKVAGTGEIRASPPDISGPDQPFWYVILDNRYSQLPSDKTVTLSADLNYTPAVNTSLVVFLVGVIVVSSVVLPVVVWNAKRQRRGLTPTASPPKGDSMFCRECGKQIARNSSFCNYCGAEE